MIELTKQRHESVLALHGWSAVFLGLLLYWIILTGSVVVLAQEINAWANPMPDVTVGELPTNVDALVRPIIADMPPESRRTVSAFIGDAGLMRMFIEGSRPDPDGGRPEQLQRRNLEINPANGNLVTNYDFLREQAGEDPLVAGTPQDAAIGELGHFFVDWHVSLHLPRPWGLLLTGILGLAMLVAAITGFLLHRHLFKELFTLRRFKGGLIKERDAHVIAGTWSLPFTFLLAFTGSFYSLAGSFAIPAVAMVNYGGGQERLVEELVGAPEPGALAIGSLTNLDDILADTRARFGLQPNSIQVINSGTDATVVRTSALPADGDMVARTFEYDGLTGQFLTERALIGPEPNAGATAFGLMAPLHFGNFAGLASKLVWLALGLAGAYVSFTGLTLFTRRREAEGRFRWLAVATMALGYGLPIAMAVCAGAYFVALAAARPVEPVMMLTLGLVLLAFLLLTTWQRARLDQLGRRYRQLLGLALLALPAVRMLTGGPGWPMAFDLGFVWVVALDSAMIIAGIAFLRPQWFRITQPKAATAMQAG